MLSEGRDAAPPPSILDIDDRELVLELAKTLEDGGKQHVEMLLGRVGARSNPSGVAAQRLMAVIHSALTRRANGELAGGNLYVKKSGHTNMLAAFQVLVGATPLVRFGHFVANAALSIALMEEERVHIVDLGFGTGIQWFNLIEEWARLDRPPILRLTAIDLPAPGQDPKARLREVGKSLEAHAASLGLIGFRFQSIACAAEDLVVESLTSGPGETLAVNAAFFLHHLPDGSVVERGPRNMLLRRIRDLNPKILTLVEPDSEHHALPFLPRMEEAMRHYGAVFEALDAVLPQKLAERRVIEEVFFGAEISNVLAYEGVDRVERHQRWNAWSARLTNLGFEAYNLTPLASSLAADLQLPEGFRVTTVQGVLRLSWQDTPLLAAGAWY